MGANRYTQSSAKGFNVNPTTDMTMLRIEDVDCSSASNCALTPIDGQFLVAPGKIGKDGFVTSNALTNRQFYSDLGPSDCSEIGSGLAMVWLSGWRGDTGGQSTTVPVVRGALRFKTKLFNVWDKAALPSHATNGYVPGAPLTVQCCAGTTFNGTTVDTNTQLILTPAKSVPAAGAALVTTGVNAVYAGWIVGYVTRVVVDSILSGTAEIEVQLYDKPILQGQTAV